MNCNSESLCVRRSESEPECPHSGGNDLHVSPRRTQRGRLPTQLLRLLNAITPKKAKIRLLGMFAAQKCSSSGCGRPYSFTLDFLGFPHGRDRGGGAERGGEDRDESGKSLRFSMPGRRNAPDWAAATIGRRLHKVESQPGTLPSCSAPTGAHCTHTRSSP